MQSTPVIQHGGSRPPLAPRSALALRSRCPRTLNSTNMNAIHLKSSDNQRQWPRPVRVIPIFQAWQDEGLRAFLKVVGHGQLRTGEKLAFGGVALVCLRHGGAIHDV